MQAYDSVFYHYIAEIYNDIEYASLTEETAEQIWSSKIDIFEGSDAQDQRARSIFVSLWSRHVERDFPRCGSETWRRL